jgi:beta-N-acetylhexosaminidase
VPALRKPQLWFDTAPMSVHARRRLVAILLAAAAIGIVWVTLFGGDGDDDSTAESPRGVSEPVAALARGLSPEERVNQVLLLGFDGTDPSSPILETLASEELGGVLVGPQNWVDAEQGSTLAGALRATGLAERRTPPLIVASQEGGEYRSFPDLPPGQTELEVGDAGSIQGAAAWALETGRALRAAGFDLNLFPVADVATLDSPIADRAFSDDPVLAASMTAASVRGCRAARIACAAIHFPGLGAASQDTDQGPATVSLDPASLADRDLQAFDAAFDERVPAVGLSLSFYAAYDPVTPAALSEAIATGLLRDQLAYDGLAITDDLGAGAIKAGYEVPEAAVTAIQAGADMLQIGSPDDQDGVREALLEAVRSGAISEDRLAEAAGRVLELKRSRGLLRLP